jgi:hypothetical protein
VRRVEKSGEWWWCVGFRQGWLVRREEEEVMKKREKSDAQGNKGEKGRA